MQGTVIFNFRVFLSLLYSFSYLQLVYGSSIFIIPGTAMDWEASGGQRRFKRRTFQCRIKQRHAMRAEPMTFFSGGATCLGTSGRLIKCNAHS